MKLSEIVEDAIIYGSGTFELRKDGMYYLPNSGTSAWSYVESFDPEFITAIRKMMKSFDNVIPFHKSHPYRTPPKTVHDELEEVRDQLTHSFIENHRLRFWVRVFSATAGFLLAIVIGILYVW